MQAKYSNNKQDKKKKLYIKKTNDNFLPTNSFSKPNFHTLIFTFVSHSCFERSLRLSLSCLSPHLKTVLLMFCYYQEFSLTSPFFPSSLLYFFFFFSFSHHKTILPNLPSWRSPQTSWLTEVCLYVAYLSFFPSVPVDNAHDWLPALPTICLCVNIHHQNTPYKRGIQPKQLSPFDVWIDSIPRRSLPICHVCWIHTLIATASPLSMANQSRMIRQSNLHSNILFPYLATTSIINRAWRLHLDLAFLSLKCVLTYR